MNYWIDGKEPTCDAVSGNHMIGSFCFNFIHTKVVFYCIMNR